MLCRRVCASQNAATHFSKAAKSTVEVVDGGIRFLLMTIFKLKQIA